MTKDERSRIVEKQARKVVLMLETKPDETIIERRTTQMARVIGLAYDDLSMLPDDMILKVVKGGS